MDNLENDVVASLDTAKIGSVVWRYHSERPRREAGEYVGRGVWVAEAITGMNRATLEVHGSKFDRKTGVGRPHRGFSTNDRIAGRHEWELFAYDQARWKIADKVKYADIETLRQIADLVGWKP